MLTRDAILSQMQRRTRVEPSAVFGGEIKIQELMRSEYRAAQAAADKGLVGETDRIRAIQSAVQLWAVAHIDILDADAQAALLTALNAGKQRTDTDRWNAGIFAAAVVDADGAPLFTTDDVLRFPERSDVWDEVLRIAQAALDLSEVGTDALKKPSSDSPETTAETTLTEATSTP